MAVNAIGSKEQSIQICRPKSVSKKMRAAYSKKGRGTIRSGRGCENINAVIVRDFAPASHL